MLAWVLGLRAQLPTVLSANTGGRGGSNVVYAGRRKRRESEGGATASEGVEKCVVTHQVSPEAPKTCLYW